MRLKVNHATRYKFDPPMRGLVQSLRLWPSVFEGQTVIDWSVTVEGAEIGAAFRDGAGDKIATATTLTPVSEAVVLVQGEIETVDLTGVVKGHREKVPPLAYLRPTHATEPDADLRALAENAVDGIAPDAELDRAHALARAIRDAITYSPGTTDATTTASEALSQGHGVCQDHAHALIGAAIAVDMPARYVVGYLNTMGEYVGAEASHAWAEIHVHGLGWVGFDAANGVSPDANYIRIGSGYDATDAALIRGIAQGMGAEALDVDVSVVESAQQ